MRCQGATWKSLRCSTRSGAEPGGRMRVSTRRRRKARRSIIVP
ncbi:hypothetical protein ACFPRL_12230 [Pseudoclavibacter helvolus]